MVRFGRVDTGVMRVDRGVMRTERRIVRRTIRRTLIISMTALVVIDNHSYYTYNNQQCAVLQDGDKYVIEDPDDPEGYIELQIRN